MVFLIIIVMVCAFIAIINKINRDNQNQYGAAKISTKRTESFDKASYDRKNKYAVEGFESRHDLNTVEGILSIPVPQRKQTTEPFSVVSTPEQILQKKATTYKKENKMDLAIACLKKSNEFMKVSWYSYVIKDFMRLVDFLYMNAQFEEARLEKQKIYDYFGYNEIEMYTDLMNRGCYDEAEKKAYYNRIIKPLKEELSDKEDYYWLLEFLPEIAPKSFSGYRRMKNAQSANYLKLVESAKEKGRVIN